MLLDSRVTRLMMSFEFARKQGFKLKKIKKSIYIRNADRTFNKEGLIASTIKINIFYKKYR